MVRFIWCVYCSAYYEVLENYALIHLYISFFLLLLFVFLFISKIGRHNNNCSAPTKLRCEILYGGIIIIIILRLLINKYRFVLALYSALPIRLVYGMCMRAWVRRDFVCERLLFSCGFASRNACTHDFDVYFSKQFCFNVLIKFLTFSFSSLLFFFIHILLLSVAHFTFRMVRCNKNNKNRDKNIHLLLVAFIIQNCIHAWNAEREWKCEKLQNAKTHLELAANSTRTVNFFVIFVVVFHFLFFVLSWTKHKLNEYRDGGKFTVSSLIVSVSFMLSNACVASV